MIADLHSHTIASGHAFGSLLEMVSAAERAGVSILGVTDHGPSMEGAPPPGYFEMTRRLPRTMDGMTVLVGCEANIVAVDGRIDLDEEMASWQPLLLAGLHGRTPFPMDLSVTQNTDAILGAMANPAVDVIAHPARTGFPVDGKTIGLAALEYSTLLEVNLALFATLLATVDDPGAHPVVQETRAMLQALSEAGGSFVISSDAHHTSELVRFGDLTEKVCALVGADPLDAANSDHQTLARVLRALSE